MPISEINTDLPLIMCYLDALGFSSENKDIVNTLFSWDEEAFIPLQGYQQWMHPRYCNKTKSLGKLVNNKKDFVFTHSFTNKNYARGFTSLNVPDLKVPSFEASILFMLVSHGQVFINNGDVTSCFVDSRDRGYGQIYLPYAKEVIDLIEAKKPNISSLFHKSTVDKQGDWFLLFNENLQVISRKLPVQVV